MNPIVSVCVPTHKTTPYLRETVGNIFSQTLRSWELVLCINSTDAAVVEAIKGSLSEFLKDPRVRLIVEARPLNMAGNWNAAVSHAHGEFIKLLCHDDLLYPDSLERQVKSLQDHPEAVLASGARTIINGKGKPLFTRSGIRKQGIHPGRKMIRECLMAGTNIIGDPVNVMWRRSAIEKIGYFDPTVVYCTDIEYWLRLLSIGDLYYDTKPVGFYRIHPAAAGVGLADVTVQDFLHTAHLQEKLGNVKLSPMDRRLIALRSRLQSMLRQYLYRILGS